MKRGSQWTWGCPCLPVVPSGCVFGTSQLISFMSLCSQHTKVCRNAGDVRTFLSQQQVIDVSSSLSWGRWRCVFYSLIEVNLMFSSSRQVLRWDSATTIWDWTPSTRMMMLGCLQSLPPECEPASSLDLSPIDHVWDQPGCAGDV